MKATFPLSPFPLSCGSLMAFLPVPMVPPTVEKSKYPNHCKKYLFLLLGKTGYIWSPKQTFEIHVD